MWVWRRVAGLVLWLCGVGGTASRRKGKRRSLAAVGCVGAALECICLAAILLCNSAGSLTLSCYPLLPSSSPLCWSNAHVTRLTTQRPFCPSTWMRPCTLAPCTCLSMLGGHWQCSRWVGWWGCVLSVAVELIRGTCRFGAQELVAKVCVAASYALSGLGLRKHAHHTTNTVCCTCCHGWCDLLRL